MPQLFRFGIYAWNIDKAKQIIKDHPRKPVMVPVKNLLSTQGIVRVDEKHAKTVNLKEPVILGWILAEGTWFHILIDGNHRVYKANKLNRKRIPAYILTKEENYQVLEGFERERLHPDKAYISQYLGLLSKKRSSRDRFYRERIENFTMQLSEENWSQEAVDFKRIHNALVLRSEEHSIDKDKLTALEKLIAKGKCLGARDIDWIYFGGQHPETKYRIYFNLNPDTFETRQFCNFMTWFSKALGQVAYGKIPSALFASRFYKCHDSFIIYTTVDEENLQELIENCTERLESFGLELESPPSEIYTQPEANIVHSFHGDLANLVQETMKDCLRESEGDLQEFLNLTEKSFDLEGNFTKKLLDKGLIL